MIRRFSFCILQLPYNLTLFWYFYEQLSNEC